MEQHPFIVMDQDETNESLLMHDIARLMKKYFDRRARSLNLTRAQWLALATLRRYPGINQVELADRLDVEPMTIARLVDRLEQAGWVERRVDRSDRRSNLLYLTERAQGIIKQLRSLWLETRVLATQGLTPQEHQALVSALGKIKKNVCGLKDHA